MDDTFRVDQQTKTNHDLYAALMLSNLLDSEQDVKEKQQQQQQEIEKEKEEQEEEEDTISLITAIVAAIKEEEEPAMNHDVIWVPADKHPEIAPNEFANFIATHGANTPLRKNSSLRRRKSILSQSLSVKSNRLPEKPPAIPEEPEDNEETNDLNRSLSEKKRQFLKKVMADNEKLKSINTNHATTVFDRNSSSIDDSRIIVPQRTDKSLSRRSAFSARGKNRKEDRQQQQAKRSLSTRTANENSKIIWDKAAGVGISLYDQPVNMSEWIDLGSASLIVDSKSNKDSGAQRGILSRVHDAESQLQLQQQQQQQLVGEKNGKQQEDQKNDLQDKEEEVDLLMLSELPPLTLQLSLPTNREMEKEEENEEAGEKAIAARHIKPQDGPKRPSMVRSSTENINIPPVVVTTNNEANNNKRPAKPEKRTSWLSGLFSNHTTSNSTSALSGLTTLFTKSISLKSSSHHLALNNFSNTDTTATNTFNNKNTKLLKTTKTTSMLQKDLKKRSSRLDLITSSTLPTPPILNDKSTLFINSNRLPLHVERSVYRLSHFKLTDPKRPLKEQVLISNLMFWYLSVQQNDFMQPAQQQQQQIAHIVMEEAMPPKEQQPTRNKMSRLIQSAKKRKNEVAQSKSQVDTIVSNTTTPKKNVQFSLTPIPSHHNKEQVEEEGEEDEEDENIPLSHYKVNSIQK